MRACIGAAINNSTGLRKERAREEKIVRRERDTTATVIYLILHSTTAPYIQQQHRTGHTCYIPTNYILTSRPLHLCKTATATATLQATHGNTPARARTSVRHVGLPQKETHRGLACLRQSDSCLRATRALRRSKPQTQTRSAPLLSCSAVPSDGLPPLNPTLLLLNHTLPRTWDDECTAKNRSRVSVVCSPACLLACPP